MELEGYLDILLALQDGSGHAHDVAQRTGMAVHEASTTLGLMRDAGFIDPHPMDGASRMTISRLGRRLLDSGYEECYKRALWERLGGDLESAS